MMSIAGERADQLAELTCDRRAARYAEISGWWRSVDAGEWFGKGYRLLADWAVNRPFTEAKTMIEAWAATERKKSLEAEQADQFESRSLSVTKLSPRSMGNVTGQLDNEGTALVRAALSMLSVPSEGDTRTRGQRNADALVVMARFALAHYDRPVGTKRRPPKANIVLSYESLLSGAGVSLLDEHLITPDSARRLACDAGVHRMITHAGSAIVDYGRRTRSVPDALWRLLVERDRGCRFAGCEVPAEMCDAHHAKHWADDGETVAHNMALLCWFHHHVLHEQHFSLEPLGAGHFVLRSPDGTIHEFSPPRLDVLTRTDQLSLAPA